MASNQELRIEIAIEYAEVTAALAAYAEKIRALGVAARAASMPVPAPRVPIKRRPLTLDVLAEDGQTSLDNRRLGLRLFALAGVDPNDVALSPPPVVHRNHIEYSAIARGPHGGPLVNLKRREVVTKRRTVRNPMPSLLRPRTIGGGDRG